ITNAQLMNNEMADKLKQIGVKVLISIDGADSVIYEEIKKGASWEKMLENAKLSSACGILHGITVVLSKHNLHQIKDFVLLAEELGAKHIIFIPLQPFKSDAYSRLSLTAADYRIAINEVLSLKTEIDISFDEPFFTPFAKKLMPNKLNSGIVVNEFKGCILGDYIYIQTNGDIRPCMFAPTELTIGNVQNEPLSDLWTKMQNHTLLKELKDQSLRKGKCGECQHFDDCGGCPTRIRGTHHNWFESDPACPLI
ncbi:MAG: SPASM domain-containing protein, partial [Candidatus Stahlbacteria bacterium]|nr:SPASM domain-containing protein [Candidatus Stahlbacteria bacterium]